MSDDGITWHPIWQAATQSQDEWRQYTVDISAAAQSAGVTLGPDFRIKFQQYDNQPRPLDGRAWDDIVVTATLAEEHDPGDEEPNTDPPYEGDLRAYIAELPHEAFKRGRAIFRHIFDHKIKRIQRTLDRGHYRGAERRTSRLLRRVDGCPATATAGERSDRNGWVSDCEVQRVIRTELDSWLSELRQGPFQ